MGHLDHNNNLIGWNFKPSQPQGIILSGLKTMFHMSPIYSAHKSSNQSYLETIKPVLIQIYKKQQQQQQQHPLPTHPPTHPNIKHKNFEELVPSVLPLLKKKKCIRLNLVRAVITSACECFAMYAGGHTWA